MASNFKVDKNSLAIVTRNMNSALAKITKKSRAGLIAAGLHILGKSNDMVPIQYGNLKASGTVIWDNSMPNGNHFTDSDEKMNTDRMITEVKSKLKSGLRRFDVAIGYGASYAIFVHEDMPGHPNKHPNGGEAKFLEKAIQQAQADVIKIVKEYSKVR